LITVLNSSAVEVSVAPAFIDFNLIPGSKISEEIHLTSSHPIHWELIGKASEWMTFDGQILIVTIPSGVQLGSYAARIIFYSGDDIIVGVPVELIVRISGTGKKSCKLLSIDSVDGRLNILWENVGNIPVNLNNIEYSLIDPITGISTHEGKLPDTEKLESFQKRTDFFRVNLPRGQFWGKITFSCGPKRITDTAMLELSHLPIAHFIGLSLVFLTFFRRLVK